VWCQTCWPGDCDAEDQKAAARWRDSYVAGVRAAMEKKFNASADRLADLQTFRAHLVTVRDLYNAAAPP
jgi:hypothetical protein